MSRPAPLALALGMALATLAATDAHGQPTQPASGVTGTDLGTRGRDHEKQLEEVRVTAVPLSEPGVELIQPTDILVGAALEQQRAQTIGETVDRLPGVQSSYFGPNVGRPIIRGLDGPRVQVLAGGLSTLDVSTVSVDHAVTIEPFLADQIEVLKGPSTLLYGSSAIGGVVNVVDGRVPTQPVDGVTGRAELSHNSVNSSNIGLLRVDAGNGEWALHADLARRDGDDFKNPEGGRILNSQSETTSGALGIGWTGDNAYAGIALTRYTSVYGIPIAADDDDDDDALAPIGFLAPKAGEGEAVALDIDQDRVEGKIGLRALGTFESIELSLVRSRYEHLEIELEDGSVGTAFANDAHEGRLVAELQARGAWQSAFGLTFGQRDFEALGDEAFVPPSEASDLGAFALVKGDFAPWSFELGGRIERVESELRDGSDSTSKRPGTLSFGARYDLSETLHASVNLARAERSPTLEELYSNGPHAATGSFEIGDPGLGIERANHAELGLHFHGDRLEWRAAAFTTGFDNFIYLRDTGEVFDEDESPSAGKDGDELPIFAWTGRNARFSGVEGDIRWTFAESAAGTFAVRGFGDRVRARLANGGGNLPRIAPSRLGAGLDWEFGSWRASLGGARYFRQDKVAGGESSTPGFTHIDAHLSYGFDAGAAEWELFADVTNLGNSTGFLHTSFLKDVAPLPGRGIAFGVRAFF